MGDKSRGNYPSGGWCGKRPDCANAGKRCEKCIRFDQFVRKEEKGC